MNLLTFEGRTYRMLPHETALEGLIRGGADVNHSCRRGTCQCCLLKATSGSVPPGSQRGLSVEQQEQGYFLPCQCAPLGPLTIERPRQEELFQRARIESAVWRTSSILCLTLEVNQPESFLPGHSVNLRTPAGLVRTYSVANLPGEDYFLQLHIRALPEGEMSAWLRQHARADIALEMSAAFGSCVYRGIATDAPLLLVGTGTAGGMLLGIARHALSRGHNGAISLVHGVRDRESLYLADELDALERQFDNFRALQCVSGADGEPLPSAVWGRASDAAWPFVEREVASDASWESLQVFSAGGVAAVTSTRVEALRRGVLPAHLHSDTFSAGAQNEPPADKKKMKELQPDPELWQALGEGKLLRGALEDFYDRAFEDERLAPFFHRVTKDRAIGKQYEFLVDLITGSRHYFGLSPFNAHHWMVISDELFDYREQLMEEVLRHRGLRQPYLGRLRALHELFRSEIVKTRVRGLFVDGRERMLEGFDDEVLEVDFLCDGCEAAMPAGARGRLEKRTGRLFCGDCAAQQVVG